MAEASALPISTPGRVRTGILLMVACSLIFASLDAMAKFMGARYPTLEVVWFRYTFHVVGMVVVFGPIMGRSMFHANNWRWQLVRGLILVVCTALSFTGLQYLPLAEFTAVAFVTPLLVTLLAGPVLGEKVSAARWGAVVLGFGGMLIVIRPGSGLFGWPALIPLVMSFVYALFQLLTRKYAGADNPINTLFFSGLAGAVLSSCAVPFVWQTPQPAHWAPLMLMGIMGGGGHLLLMLCFRRAPASVLAPFSYTQLAFAVLISIVLLNHVPDHWSLIGMGVIAVAGLYAVVLQTLEARAGRRVHPVSEAEVTVTD